MMYNFIIAHFQKYKQRRPWSFCWRITIEGFIFSWVIVLFVHLIFHLQPRKDLQSLSPLRLLIYSLMLGPWIETLLCQSLPIYLARLFKTKFYLQILVSTLVFAIPHFWSGVGAGIGAGIVGGFYLSFTYAHWREKSFWIALSITAISHMLHNSLALVPATFIHLKL